MRKYIIGIDGGSQSTKVVMYDTEGNVVCEGKGLLQPMYTPDADTVEHQGDDLWESLCHAGKDLMNNFTGDVDEIVGIGLGSIRCCRALLRADGTPVKLINWQDARINRPYEHSDDEVAYIASFSGYITNRLTGERKDCVGNCWGQWPTDFNTWDWSEDESVIERFGIPRKMLFETVLPGKQLGSITEAAAEATGFPVGLPVFASTSDKAVESLGAGLVNDEMVVISLGTYIALMMSGQELPKDTQSYWPIMSSMPNVLLYEGYGIRRGMWTVSWLRDLLGESLIKEAKANGLSPEDFLNEKASSIPPGSDGLITVLDWLHNPWEPYKRGIILGFHAAMDYSYMYRSILESIALTMKNNYDNMRHELQRDGKELVITGGGSNSDLFMQIFADVFDMPTKRNVINGCASLGSAINAAVGLGIYDSYQEAVAKMVKVKDVFMPVKENVNIYDTLNTDLFRDLTKDTDEILKKSYKVFRSNVEEVEEIQSYSVS
jgi:sugar (pentulose or hexulose) kinase